MLTKLSVTIETILSKPKLSLHDQQSTNNPMNVTKYDLENINLAKKCRSYLCIMGFPGDSDSKESACNAGDLGSIPGLRRSPGGGHATNSSILAQRIPMDRGAWRATEHGVTKSQT